MNKTESVAVGSVSEFRSFSRLSRVALKVYVKNDECDCSRFVDCEEM